MCAITLKANNNAVHSLSPLPLNTCDTTIGLTKDIVPNTHLTVPGEIGGLSVAFAVELLI